MADAFSGCLEQAMLSGGAGNLVLKNGNTNFKKFAKLNRTYNFEDAIQIEEVKKGDDNMDFDDFKDILDDMLPDKDAKAEEPGSALSGTGFHGNQPPVDNV
jgi:hypothetical protein